jgi:hypothetical protein
MGKQVTPLGRVQRELAAEQIGINPMFRKVFEAMRRLSTGVDQKTASALLGAANQRVNAMDIGDPVTGPLRRLRFFQGEWFLESPMAWRCLETLVECANNGELDRFRECLSCKRWFFARKSDHVCCTSGCRQKVYQSTPGAKKEKAKYMRNFRKELKERALRQEKLFREQIERDRKHRRIQ